MPFEKSLRARRYRVLPFVAAVGGVIAATIVIFAIPPLVERGAFIIYLAVVSLVTWFCGWRPGLLAILLAAVLMAWFILPPNDSIYIEKWEDVLRLAVFLLVAGMLALLHASRERAREMAWQTEQRLAFALQSAGMGAWYSDLRTGKFWWSEGMEKLFGRPPGEFSGTYEGFIGYIHPEDQDFVKRAVTHTIEGGKEFEIEHRIVTPDGQTRWILTRGQITCDESGNPLMVIGVAGEVTERTDRGPLAAQSQQ